MRPVLPAFDREILSIYGVRGSVHRDIETDHVKIRIQMAFAWSGGSYRTFPGFLVQTDACEIAFKAVRIS